MSTLTEPFTSYVFKNLNHKGIAQKYWAYRQIMSKYLKDGDSVADLFGGIGVLGGMALDTAKLKKLFIMDISEDCIKILKDKYAKNPLVEIVQGNSFELKDLSQYNLILLDSHFKFIHTEKFDALFKEIAKTNAIGVITELEIYKITFVKKDGRNIAREKHVGRLVDLLRGYGFNVAETYYNNTYCHTVFGKTIQDMPKLIEIPEEYKDWIKYT